MSDAAAAAIAKKLQLPYRKSPTQYSLRLNQRLKLLSGYREQPQQAKQLTRKQLRRLAKQLRITYLVRK
jgi:hypothetical protein